MKPIETSRTAEQRGRAIPNAAKATVFSSVQFLLRRESRWAHLEAQLIVVSVRFIEMRLHHSGFFALHAIQVAQKGWGNPLAGPQDLL